MKGTLWRPLTVPHLVTDSSEGWDKAEHFYILLLRPVLVGARLQNPKGQAMVQKVLVEILCCVSKGT